MFFNMVITPFYIEGKMLVPRGFHVFSYWCNSNNMMTQLDVVSWLQWGLW